MNIVIAHSLFAPFGSLLRGILGARHALRFVGAGECADPELDFDSAEVLVTARFPAEWGPRFPSLRLLHAAGAGLDKIDTDALPPGTRICNTFGHGASIAEHVLMVMLALSRRLVPADRELRSGNWLCPQFNAGVPLPETLAGKTVVILGTGEIGSATAVLCGSFGMNRIGVNRSGRAPPGGVFDRCAPLSALAEVLPLADSLVLALPLEANTRGLIDRAALARLKPSASLVNVARGPVVDEQALYDALKGGSLAGAALDVWYGYPAHGSHRGEPARLPFRELDNVIMTPHMSGVTRATFEHRARDIAHNILALESGRPLRNEVTAATAGHNSRPER